MASNWPTAKLGEVIELFDSQRVPLNSRQRQERQGKFPYYGAQGIIDYIDGYIFDGRYILVAEDGENLNSKKLPLALFASGKFWVNNHAHILRGKQGIADDTFLLACLNNANIRPFVTGAAQPKLSQGNLRLIEIPLPPLPVQRRIAGILSAYDELIENSQRRIKILESMARALYREWFVHFRFPGHEHHPRVPSPLGEIPQGWLLPLTDHVDFKEGPGLRNWQYRDEGIPFLNIRTLVDNDIDFSKIQYLDPQEVEKKYQHFLLSELDHVVSSSGTIGRIVTIRAEHLPLMLNTSIIRMRPKGCRMGCWLLKHYMLSDYFQNQAKSFAIGAAQANFGPIHLKQMKIIAPDEGVASEYEIVVGPMELQILALARQIQILRRTRDLLLPRLLSGQIGVEGNER